MPLRENIGPRIETLYKSGTADYHNLGYIFLILSIKIKINYNMQILLL